MARKTPRPAQGQNLPPLPAETLEAINAAVFLYEGEPAITLSSLDSIYGRSSGAARVAFNRCRVTLFRGQEYDTPSTVDFEGFIERNKLLRCKSGKGGFYGQVTILYKEGFLAVANSFSGDSARQIRDAVTEVFDRLENEELLRSMASRPVVFAYGDVPVHANIEGLVDAKDMYKAAGSPPNKEPWRFLETEPARRLLSHKSVIHGKSEVFHATRGRYGSTWMSRKLAIAYAAYLSPEFFSFILDVFEAWGTGKLVPANSVAPVPAAFDPEQFSASLVERVAAVVQQGLEGNRQEIVATRESLSGEIAATRQDIGGEIIATGEKIVAVREGLSQEITQRFTRTENFILDRNKDLFVSIMKMHEGIVEKLVKIFRSDALHLLDKVLEVIHEEFARFEERWAAAASQAPNQSAPRVTVDDAGNWLRLLIAWRMTFGDARTLARDLAALEGGSLVAGANHHSKSVRVGKWATNMAGTVFCLSDGRRVRLQSEPIHPSSGLRVYWLAEA